MDSSATELAKDNSAFSLHERLAADCELVGDLPLCRVLLLNDSRYPWLVLVPRRAGITEAYQLSEEEQQQLWKEVTAIGKQLMAETGGHKLNIGALGNLVPQLHVHVLVRSPDDEAWPGPVWGVGEARGYSAEALRAMQKIAENCVASISH